MQVNSAQDYLTAQKRQIVAKTSVNSPQPAHRKYNYVYTSVLANAQSQFEKVAYPQTLSLAAGSRPGLAYVTQGVRPTVSLCCDPYADVKLAATPAAVAPLYAFTTFTFTPAGATGRNGPTLSAAVSAYTATAPWATNTAYFNMTTQGYQLWTVPQTRSYRVTCAGAAAGFFTDYGASYGAIIQTTLSLTSGQIIQLLVGQRGGSNSEMGGGGGSFVASGLTPAAGVCLVAAGGGGGMYDSAPPVYASTNGTNSTTGNSSTSGAAGGSGGSGGVDSNTYAGAGGGFTGNGGGGSIFTSSGGLSFTNGGTGGGSEYTGVGGFGGGGGGGNTSQSGGGGGGYSGGGCGTGFRAFGGGGGSFPSGATFIGATNAGQGYITITAI